MPKYQGYSFGLQPASKLAKTIMSQPNTHSTTFNFAKVVPIQCTHVVPGDIISKKIAGLIRMSTPKAPIMTNLKGSLHAFFVPMRLVWEHTKEFYGENPSSKGPQTGIPYTIPQIVVNGTANTSLAAELVTVGVGSVAHYLGYPLRKHAYGDSYDRTLNVLPLRGYWSIINEYYRAQQVMDPYLVATGDADGIGTYKGSQIGIHAKCADSLKNFDIFTTSLIAPTYGGETSIPLLGNAPLIIGPQYQPGAVGGDERYSHIFIGPSKYYDNTIKGTMNVYSGYVTDGTVVEQPFLATVGETEAGIPGASVRVDSTNLYADLSLAATAKLNDLYLAMAVEKWKYHANYGTRYFERLEVSYGTRNPDLVLSRPEHLGEFHFDINVQTVLATATTDGANLGQPGANSATAFKCNLFNHSFGEYGYLYVLLNTYQDHRYSAGVDRMFTDKDILDLYWPEFANKGDEKVLLDNIYFDESLEHGDKEIFGYQEAWAFERFTISRVSGLLDPYVDTSLNSSVAGLSGFIAESALASAPSLDEDFLKENRSGLASCLVTGTTGPDFVADFLFEDKVTRSILPRSEPGIPGRIW